MQLPEKYRENFDVSSEGPSSGVITSKGLRSKRRNSPYIFQVVDPHQRKLVHLIGTTYTGKESSRDILTFEQKKVYKMSRKTIYTVSSYMYIVKPSTIPHSLMVYS
jgi:hypothetical protein